LALDWPVAPRCLRLNAGARVAVLSPFGVHRGLLRAAEVDAGEMLAPTRLEWSLEAFASTFELRNCGSEPGGGEVVALSRLRLPSVDLSWSDTSARGTSAMPVPVDRPLRPRAPLLEGQAAFTTAQHAVPARTPG
jgi:hypothetical protein